MKKTEYRIIPYKTFLAEMFLQFKYYDGKNTVRCFIPKKQTAYVLGENLTQESCPESVSHMEGAKFLCSNYEQEKYELVPFAKKYKNIEKYFEYLREKRKFYLSENERKEREAKIIYL